jgi:hypothetical protein
MEKVFARARTTLGTVPVFPSEVVVGVKSHVKLHDRIPVMIESTWGGDFKAAGVEVLYLSDSEDAELGTVNLGKEFGEVYNEKWAVCALESLWTLREVHGCAQSSFQIPCG